MGFDVCGFELVDSGVARFLAGGQDAQADFGL